MVNKTVLAMVLGIGCLVGGYHPAFALNDGDNFSVDQSCGTPGPTSPCSESGGTISNIDEITHAYAGVVKQSQVGPVFLDGDDPFIEKGFTTWSGYVDDSGNTTNQAPDYKVVGIFSATGTAALSGGGIDATFDTFTITFYMADDAAGTSCSLPADPSTGDATCTGSLTEIGSATLLSQGQARLFPGFALGDFRISLTNFALTDFGKLFLTDPSLFYRLMTLTGVTTSIKGASGTAPFIATLSGGGQIFFTKIPEPGSLGMLGLGLLALGLGIRYRRASSDQQ